MSNEISIQSVLNQINTHLDEGQPRVFSIGFIRKTGEGKGTYKLVRLAQKGGKTGKPASGRKRSGFRYKENKTLLLEDLDKGGHFNVGIETIIRFNGAIVRH